MKMLQKWEKLFLFERFTLETKLAELDFCKLFLFCLVACHEACIERTGARVLDL